MINLSQKGAQSIHIALDVIYEWALTGDTCIVEEQQSAAVELRYILVWEGTIAMIGMEVNFAYAYAAPLRNEAASDSDTALYD